MSASVLTGNIFYSSIFWLSVLCQMHKNHSSEYECPDWSQILQQGTLWLNICSVPGAWELKQWVQVSWLVTSSTAWHTLTEHLLCSRYMRTPTMSTSVPTVHKFYSKAYSDWTFALFQVHENPNNEYKCPDWSQVLQQGTLWLNICSFAGAREPQQWVQVSWLWSHLLQ